MEPLMQPTFKEIWNVVVGKEVFSLDEKQIKVLREATLDGNRGLIWFDDFAISVPHIQAVYLVERKSQQPLGLTEGDTKMSEERLAHNRERIAELKKVFGRREE